MVTPGVLAADMTMTFGEFVGDTEKGGTITVTEDHTTVNSEYAGIAPNMEPKEVVGNYDIELKSGSTLTLHNLNTYNVNITGVDGGYGGDIVINADKAYGNGSYSGGLIVGPAENEKTFIKANNLKINNTISGNNTLRDGIYVGSDQKGDMDIDLTGKLDITAGYYGIFSEGNTNSVINIAANTVDVNANAWAIILNGSSSVDMHIVDDINIRGGHGISNNSTETMNYESQYGNVNIHADTSYGIAAGTGDVNVKGNNNYITVDENDAKTGYVVYSTNGHVKVKSTTGNNILTGGNKTTGVYSLTNADAGVELISAQDNRVTAALNGAYSTAGTITLDALHDNIITAGTEALKADGAQSSVKAIAYRVNSITAGETIDITYDDDIPTPYADEKKVTFGKDAAAYAINGGDTPVLSGVANLLAGSVYASGEGSTVDIKGINDQLINNYIYSAAVIDGAGDLADSEDEEMAKKSVVSALYAEGSADINVTGAQNVIRSYAESDDHDTLERVVWAYDKANITIDGTTFISTDSYQKSSNSLDIAIAAGTATNLDKETVNKELTEDERAKVTLHYGEGSAITGDILSAYAGLVTIDAKNDTAGVKITGNLLSGNNGVLNVDLGNGGTLTGRADDYGDAGVVDGSGHGTEFFDPAFSSNIYKGGEVNLTMGEGSKWTVTGQSWITKVDTGNSEHVEIDLSATDSALNKTVQALTIGEMKGNAMFTMQLDGDRKVSDMLYMKKANGEYFINLKNAVTVEDMYNGFDGLRFATVGKGSHATFSAGTYGNGVYNVEYEVGTDDYATSTENNAYNSTANDGQMDAAKPGNALVDNLFKDEPQEAAANGIMTLAAVDLPEATDSSDTTEDMGTNTGMNGEVLSDTTNFKLIDVKSTELSNAGKTIIDMSKVNYSNAIYMDRLNKRMGEARYIDGDEGLWVRIRHDRIGKSDAFRSKNTMMELGYDKRVDDREDGEHRRGFAIDYMRGTTDYHNVAGDGDVRRGGVWFYDTWLGNKGHYSDYVLKFGRLSNDFDIYSELGEKITGDYSNFVYSASAEYGRKKDIGKDWYFEPQVQLQYAHVTDADYTTSQGTSVELDAIDSLIGRVGFRLGKDMGENNTFYVKADVLHEFLGDQDISAFDDTGRLDTTYENEGTWYDVGLGFSHQFSKGTYMFLDVEKTFGNDNEDTYQFNVGMNWKV